jgi:hypothetical protein
MLSEPSWISRAADELDAAHHVLVKAIAARLDEGGTWQSAFDEWETASGRFVNRLGIHSATTFRRRFEPWVTSLQEQADGAGATLAIRGEEEMR